MGRILEKIAMLFVAMVFITFLVNHGHIDFSGIDWITRETKKAVESEQGKEIISEVKDISYDLTSDLLQGVKEHISSIKICPSSNSSDALAAYSLLRVVDGDTIIIQNDYGEEIKVRLIGVDTPESVHSDEERNTEYGILASDYTKNLLADVTELYLEFDSERTDKYGRTLAYVWLKKDVNTTNKEDIANYMLNGILVRNGYAINKEYPPNTAHADTFLELRQDAEETKAGFWIYDQFSEIMN